MNVHNTFIFLLYHQVYYLSLTDLFLVTKICRDDAIVQEEDEVPLWSTLILCLHCPEEPPSTIVSIFKPLCLSKEVLGVEILLLLRKSVPASLIEATDVLRLTVWWMVRHVVSIYQVLLALSNCKGELASKCWLVSIFMSTRYPQDAVQWSGKILGLSVSALKLWLVIHS